MGKPLYGLIAGFFLPLLLASPVSAASCPMDAEVYKAADAVLAASSGGRASAHAVRAEALAAFDRLHALRTIMLETESEPDNMAVYGGVRRFTTLARNAAEPRLRELFSRVAREQFVRASFTALQQRQGWADQLSPDGSRYALHILSAEMCRADADNLPWLKADLDAHGWYRITEMGKEADNAAWLMVQHADADVVFQQKILAMLEPLVGQGETSPTNYAYLLDRVAVNSQRPQRYGTQGGCADGGWEPRALEEPATAVDQRRAEVGLPPLADYIAAFKANGLCP